jgi:hypothetical protein
MQSFNQPPHGSTLQGWMRRNNEAGHFFSQPEEGSRGQGEAAGYLHRARRSGRGGDGESAFEVLTL